MVFPCYMGIWWMIRYLDATALCGAVNKPPTSPYDRRIRGAKQAAVHRSVRRLDTGIKRSSTDVFWSSIRYSTTVFLLT